MLDTSASFLMLAAVETPAVENRGLSKADVKEMLEFMHDLGVVVHFGTSDSPVLRSLVVLRPKWLLDNLSRVICDRKHMKKHKRALLNEESMPSFLETDLKRWEKDGVAT